MTYEIAVVLLVVLVMLICLMKEVTRPDFIVFFALAILILTGVLSPSDALRGFSNEGMLTVALLFIVAGSVQQSGLLNPIITKAMGSGKNPRLSIFRMMVPMSALSAFLNNTPIVVMFTPVLQKWCRDHNFEPSKFLIPLSYATIFGGSITLIGTSTNLVIHGLMIEQGMDGFSMFQLAIVAVPACLLGTLYMCTVGYKLLPSRKTSQESVKENLREYLCEAIVESDSPWIGKTIEEAGLGNLEGLYLMEIVRNGQRIAPVSSYMKIKENDLLIFTGLLSTIVELENMKGFRIQTGSDIKLEELQDGTACLVEVVVSHQSSLIHKTLREARFRRKYDAGVVAIHRNQVRIKSNLGDLALRPGDTLLLMTDKDFVNRWSNTNDFYVILPVEQPEMMNSKKSFIAVATLVLMILLAAFSVLSMFKATVLAVIVLFLTKIVTFESVQKAIQFNVLILIACAIGIGIAVQETGTAEWIAQHFVQLTQGTGVLGALIIIYFLTTTFTEIITNNAAAVLMFSISNAIAVQLGVDPVAFFVTIALAASASFATPIGYQTNLIVYGPGGYRFSDYLKVGIPLNLLYLVVTVVIVYFVWII